MSTLPHDEKRLARVHSLENSRLHNEFAAIGRLKGNESNSIAYRKAYELFNKVYALTERVERTMEKAMVRQLGEACITMVVSLYKMDMAADKQKYLTEACEKLEVVEMLLKLIKEFKMIAVFYISDLEDHMKQISRQIYEQTSDLV